MAESSHDEYDKGFTSSSTEIHEDYWKEEEEYPLNGTEETADTMKDLLSHIETGSSLDTARMRSDSSIGTFGSDQNSNNLDISPHVNNINSESWSNGLENVSNAEDFQINSYKPTLQDIQMMLQQLNNERARILSEIENEEKERQWFLEQIEKIKHQQHLLPVMDNYPIQNDLTRQKLENEVQQLQETMRKKLGTSTEIVKRHESRLHSLRFIEKEGLKLKEQTDLVLNRKRPELKSNINGIEEFHAQLQNEDISKHARDTSSPSDLLRNNKMTTSATQTTVDLYPSDCSTNVSLALENDCALNSVSNGGAWPLDKVNLWHSSPTTFGELSTGGFGCIGNQETASVMSFTSSINSMTSRRSTHQLGAKVEMVYSLLSMLGKNDKDEMSKTLLSMSLSRDSCIAMRQSGCMPLLIQLIHSESKEPGSDGVSSYRETRIRASTALHNIVHAHPDDKLGRREARVLRLLEQIRDYSDMLRDSAEFSNDGTADVNGIVNTEQHPGPSMAALMKLSFDEEHRHAMCQLGGLQAIAELIEVDHLAHGNTSDQYCVTLRRYAGMALTNLTFGDGNNKALLCSFKPFMQALVAQLCSPSEDLRQVFASVLRNLSWRADSCSKKLLREVGAVTTLMKAAMEAKKESTLKSILSALWNLSAHCSMNKADICAVDGALAFLVSTLTYKSASKTLSIIENGGGILRNISSQIAVREDYRAVIRQHNCLQILLQHLTSSSLTIVSNACGTLWNLSARCPGDQQLLWEFGAVSMLKNLVNSKHKMISMGSSAALKNLLAAKPKGMAFAGETNPDGTNKTNLPSLHVRKQRALEAEIDQNLSETCDNIDSPKSSPTHRIDADHPRFSSDDSRQYFMFDRLIYPTRMYRSVGEQNPISSKHVSRSDSRDSITSTRSDTSHDRIPHGSLFYQSSNYPTAIPELRETIGNKHELESLNGAGGRGDMSPETVRITQVMKEVVQRIAMEDSLTNGAASSKPEFIGSKKNLAESLLTNQLANSIQNQVAGFAPCTQHGYDKYGEFLNSKNENLNLIDQAKFSAKCLNDDREQLLENAAAYEKEYEKAPVKVNNYMQEKSLKPNPEADSSTPPAKHGHWEDVSHSPHFNKKMFVKSCNIMEEKLNSDVYGTYAETDLDDLDQPTNYSLRYTEDADAISAVPGYSAYAENDDTMRTYCTEDTPLNFSSANSLLDLRESSDKEKLSIADEKEFTENEKNAQCEQYENRSCKSDNTGSRVTTSKAENMQEKSTLCDKPTTYFVEGTPVCFSRASSLSSLHSSDVNDQLNVNTVCNESREQNIKEVTPPHKANTGVKHIGTPSLPSSEKAVNRCKADKGPAEKEGKTVTFGEENFSEETPLMFSRCSSLGSLSSFEQHSIHDDRSSVISDFSRRASGIVSPSDLPDSPSEMPSSPKHTKTEVAFRQIYEDEIKVFAMEDTPVQFSTGTSLSALTIDDICADEAGEPSSKPATIKNNLKMTNKLENVQQYNEKNTAMSSKYIDAQIKEKEQDCDNVNLSETEENEEEILAACINSGMPNNSKQNCRKYNNTKLLSKVNKFSGPPRSRASGIPIKTNNVHMVRSPLSAAASLTPSHYGSSSAQMTTSGESIYSAKSADGHSENSSNSYLPNDLKQNYDSTNSAQGSRSETNSVDDDLLLAQCIQSGMPKQKLPKRKINGDAASMNSKMVNRPPGKFDHPHDMKNKVPGMDGAAKLRQLSNGSHFNNLVTESVRNRPTASEQFGYYSPNKNENKQNLLEENDLMASPDSVHKYAEEGTPVMISRHDSLSSLSCDEESVHGKTKLSPKDHMKDNLLSKTGKSSTSNNNNNNNNSTVLNQMGHFKEKPSLLKNCLKLSHKECVKDCVYNMKETPSVSPGARSNVSGNEQREFFVEGTPVCFSRNSSLSSLSIESVELDAEQEILDECIKSGMPSTKSNTLKSKSCFSEDKKLPLDIKEPDNETPGSGTGNAIAGNDFHIKINNLANEIICLNEDEDSLTLNCDTVSSMSIDVSQFTTAQELNSSDETTFKVLETHEISSEKPVHVTTSLSESGKEGRLSFEQEASRLAQEINCEAEKYGELMNQSTTSTYSDLDNIKPPSIMGDVVSLTCSTSSCLSESISEKLNLENLELMTNSAVRLGGTYKLKTVPELILRALSGSSEGMKAGSVIDVPDSFFNVSESTPLSVELLDNVKPPSIIDDIDLTSSTYSVASITSEIAEAKSENISMKGSVNSDMMLECMMPVIAMAELYAREGIQMPSMLSSCNTEYIENINPPSVMQELTECNPSTIQDVTSTLGSDTDAEDELPDDAVGNQINDLEKDAKKEPVKKSKRGNDDGLLNITAEEVQTLQEDANMIVSTLIALKQNMSNESSLNEDNLLECESLSLVSNDSDTDSEFASKHDELPNSPLKARGPRVTKPDSERMQHDSKDVICNNSPKAIRGRRRGLTKPRGPQQQQHLSPDVKPRSASPSPKTVSGVKPTRTSALRASQNQTKASSPVRLIDTSTITIKRKVKTSKSANNFTSQLPKSSSMGLKRSDTVLKKDTTTTESNFGQGDSADEEEDESRPKPPIKQGTFTKDKPSQESTPKISPQKNNPHAVSNKPPKAANSKPNTPIKAMPIKSRMLQSRSLDDRTQPNTGSTPHSRTSSNGSSNKGGTRRIQSPSPMNRKASNSLNNLKKGSSASNLKNSSSNQSLGQYILSGRRTPNAMNSRSGSLNSNKRSSSNLSLCSNNSSTTTNSTMTTSSSKKQISNVATKKEVTSKIASLWKKNNDDKSKTNAGSSVRSAGLPRSSTYEKIPKCNTNNSQQKGMRPEDKNQVNNKTFTKSPSVDSKMSDLISDSFGDLTRNNTTEGMNQIGKCGTAKTVQQERVPRPQALFTAASDDREHIPQGATTPSSSGSTQRSIGHAPKSLIPTPTRNLPPTSKRRDTYGSGTEPNSTEGSKQNTCIITAV